MNRLLPTDPGVFEAGSSTSTLVSAGEDVAAGLAAGTLSCTIIAVFEMVAMDLAAAISSCGVAGWDWESSLPEDAREVFVMDLGGAILLCIDIGDSGPAFDALTLGPVRGVGTTGLATDRLLCIDGDDLGTRSDPFTSRSEDGRRELDDSGA